MGVAGGLVFLFEFFEDTSAWGRREVSGLPLNPGGSCGAQEAKHTGIPPKATLTSLACSYGQLRRFFSLLLLWKQPVEGLLRF